MNKRFLGIALLLVPFFLLIAVLVMFGFTKFIDFESSATNTIYSILGIIAVVSIIFGAPIGCFLLAKNSFAFSISNALSLGWQITKQRFWLFFGVLLFTLIVAIIFSFLSEFSSIIGLINLIVSIFLSIGLIKITLSLVRGQSATFATLFSGGSVIIKYFLVSILYTLIVLGGFILFIIPGMIWSVKYSLATYLVIDKGIGPIQAIKESGRLTDGAKWDLFGWGIVMQFINLLGILLILVGLFFTYPLTMLAYSHIYNQLLAKKGIG